jgi:large subunit ribosomal protein L24
MAMKKIRRNDEVIVIAGRDKGRRGKVLNVLSGDRLLVSGVQIVKKHQKPNPQLGNPGGIVEREAPIQVSNVAIYNPNTRKADRVGFRVLEDGKKIRVFKSSGQPLDARG